MSPPPSGVGDALKEMLKHLMWGFWVATAGALVMLIASPFSKKSEKTA
jgi:hypothetical protein